MQDCGSPACIVTGATSGIGRAATIALATHFDRLILLGRNESRAGRLIESLIRQFPKKHIEFVPLELASLRDVNRAAGAIHGMTRRVDVLINNAGARIDSYRASPEGYEETFATNHLGHFLLTSLLIDQLLAVGPARIINVSSSAHTSATRPEHWLMTAENYDRRQAYARSKLANLLFTYELSRRFADSKLCVNAMHPGGVASGFARNNGWLSWSKHLLSHGLRRELISPRRGADTIVYLATSPEVAGITGKYFYRRRPVPSSPLSHESALAQNLWTESIRLCRVDSSIGPAWRYFAP